MEEDKEEEEEEEEEDHFLRCIKNSQARMVDCRPVWDSWTSRDFPLCQTMDQLKEHEDLDWLDINYEQKMIINNTGCLVPCKYKV